MEVGLNYCSAAIDAFRGARAQPDLLGLLCWFWAFRDGSSAVRCSPGMATRRSLQTTVVGDADRNLELRGLFRRGDFSELEILLCRTAYILWCRYPLSYIGGCGRSGVAFSGRSSLLGSTSPLRFYLGKEQHHALSRSRRNRRTHAAASPHVETAVYVEHLPSDI